MQLNRIRFLLTLTLLSVPVASRAQSPVGLPTEGDLVPFRSDAVTPTNGSGPFDAVMQTTGTESPLIPDPDTYPVPSPATAQPWRTFTDTKFNATFLPKNGNNGLGIADLEVATMLNIDCPLAPIKITPYAAIHYWDGPSTLELPTNLYDLNVEFAWRPRLAEWLFAELAITPGLYTDFKNVSADSFQMRGRGLGIVAFSEKLQLAAGAMYVNRNVTKILPAGGVIWTPSDDTRYFLVFPQPKISHRFYTLGDTQFWGYLAGEFGGGRWEVERASGIKDSLDYTDLRLIL
jgi:hypothetical protein